MNILPPIKTSGQVNWASRVTAKPGQSSQAVFLPDHKTFFSVSVVDSPGTATIKYTLSPAWEIESEIDNPSNVNWIDWPLGDVQKGVDGLNFPVTALKIVSTGGAAKTMEICG